MVLRYASHLAVISCTSLLLSVGITVVDPLLVNITRKNYVLHNKNTENKKKKK